jgi:hypothetical protein
VLRVVRTDARIRPRREWFHCASVSRRWFLAALQAETARFARHTACDWRALGRGKALGGAAAR